MAQQCCWMRQTWSLCSWTLLTHVWRTGIHESIGVNKSLWWWKVWLMSNVWSPGETISLEYDSIFFSQESWRVRPPFLAGSIRRLLMASPHSLSSAPGHSDSHSTSFEKDVRVTASQAALKTVYLLQMGVGSLANGLLFFYHISPVLFGHKKRPTDTILTHIAVSNLLVLLSSGIPHTMAAFISGRPLSPLGCKCVYYLQKVAHSTALCSTCVLSTYQSFTLTPGREGRSLLRGRAPRLTGSFCCTCWIFSVLMYIYVPVKITASPNRHNYTDMQGDWFCSSSSPNAGIVVLWSTSDAVFIGLMIWSCGSMVLLLHRHRQRVQYIHTPTGHHRRPPETRAAHTTLMLVVTFVVFYVVTSILAFYITAFFDFRQWLIQTSDVLLSCFPTISPFLLLLRDPRTARICSWGVSRYDSSSHLKFIVFSRQLEF